jgi:predicted PurR-regulated permease PerM
MTIPRRDLARTTLAVLCLGGLIASTLWILGPFLPSTIWAVTLVIATWPVLLRVQAALGGRRGPAAAVMTLLLLAIVVAPFGSAVSTIVKNSDRIQALAIALTSFAIPPTPAWVADLPVVGEPLSDAWDHVASAGVNTLIVEAGPYIGRVTQYFVSAVGSLGTFFVQLLLTIVVASILYSNGDRAAAVARRFGHRLAGERGQQMVLLVGQAIRGVALGVVVTALVQSMLGGIALAVAGVPFAAILTAVMFMLCIVQIGPALVLLPAVVWLYYSGGGGWTIFLAVCGLVIISLDNVLRPLLIRRGADLPMLLILVGVIGGLMAFGLIGVFVGPALLAVTYTLLQAWLAEDDPEPGSASVL